MSTPIKEFNMCVLGFTQVGKTSLMQRLNGVPFNRKHACRSSLEEEPTKFSIEVPTSAGIVLYNFYDWNWETKRKDQNINQQLMRGRDGAIFLYDCTDRRTVRDFPDYCDWYERATGFDKPYIIVSNKNDQKKKAVDDAEGMGLAKKGDHRAYCAISLVDDTGLDEMILATTKIMMKDVNINLTGSFGPASAATVQWSNERNAAATAGIGLGMPVVKTKRVLLVVLNKSVVEKFNDAIVPTEYSLEVVGSVGMAEEEFAPVAEGTETPLPVHALLVPPTASDQQQAALRELAAAHNVGFLVSVPRNLVEGLEAIGKK
eukprot:gene24859-28100_t